MIEIKSLGELSIRVADLSKATTFYQTLFDVKELISFKDFENEAFCQSMGIQTQKVSFSVLKFGHCNLTLQLIQLSDQQESAQPAGQAPISLTLQVEDAIKTLNLIREHDSIEVLGGVDFQPKPFGEINANAFTIGDAESHIDQKERIAKNLAHKHFFFFKDPFGVTWKIEERIFDSGF